MKTVPPVGTAEGCVIGANEFAVSTLILTPVCGKNGMVINDATNYAARIDSVAAIKTDAEGLRANHTLKKIHVVSDGRFRCRVRSRTGWNVIIPTSPGSPIARQQTGIGVQDG